MRQGVRICQCRTMAAKQSKMKQNICQTVTNRISSFYFHNLGHASNFSKVKYQCHPIAPRRRCQSLGKCTTEGRISTHPALHATEIGFCKFSPAQHSTRLGQVSGLFSPAQHSTQLRQVSGDLSPQVITLRMLP